MCHLRKIILYQLRITTLQGGVSVGRGLRVDGWSVGSIQVGFVVKTRDLGSDSIIVILEHIGQVFLDFGYLEYFLSYTVSKFII